LIGQPLVFVDSAAWVALIDASDRQHSVAEEYWRSAIAQSQRFLTSNYVLDETYTLLRRRPRGLEMAIAIHDTVESSRLVETAALDDRLLRHAWDLFTGYRDKILSFTDCTSFALMQQRDLSQCFTFDADFQRVGFTVLPIPALRPGIG
jgi:hypothetical protein